MALTTGVSRGILKLSFASKAYKEAEDQSAQTGSYKFNHLLFLFAKTGTVGRVARRWRGWLPFVFMLKSWCYILVAGTWEATGLICFDEVHKAMYRGMRFDADVQADVQMLKAKNLVPDKNDKAK